MSVCKVAPREFADPISAPRFTVLAIDGGGIRGVIAARVLAELERLVGERPGGPGLSDCFDLISGTSTGGLITVGLASPGEGAGSALTAAEQVELYTGEDGRAIFERPPLRRLPLIGRLSDYFRPRYGLTNLREVLERHVGEAKVGDALTEVLITSYDMRGREPVFFKRWTEDARETTMVDAGLATSAAPTFFPSHGVGDRALIDGGVFAANPTVAAIAESLKRTEDPGGLRRDQLLVVSLGTGDFEIGFEQAEVERWGSLEWILPNRKSGEPPLIGAMLDGQSDAAHHWAHVLLNHEPGEQMESAEALGAGPHYYRYEVELTEPLPLDGVSDANIAQLTECADALVDARSDELEAIADVLAERRSPSV